MHYFKETAGLEWDELTEEEKDIQTMMDDFELFAKNCLTIIDNNGDAVPFIMNKEQRDFIKDAEDANIILKGRQIGFTTLSLCLMLYMAIRFPNTNYFIMSQSAKVSKGIFKRLKDMFDRLPHKEFKKLGYDLFHEKKLSNRDEFELTNGSRIIVATSSGENDISSNTFQLIHFSEFGLYQTSDIQEEVLAAAVPALAKNPDAKIIIESTARGHNHFHDLFMRNWKARNNNPTWKPFFFSWLAKAYEKQYKHAYDDAEKWFVRKHGEKMNKDYLDVDEMELYTVYGATFRQLMFRRKYIDKQSLNKFKREMPTTPAEAFSTTSTSVFDMQRIIESQEISKLSEHQPLPTKAILTSSVPVSLKKYVGNGLTIYNLPTEQYPSPYDGKMRKRKYFAGVDGSLGRGADNSVVVLINEDGKEVAKFSDNRTPTFKFAQACVDLCAWYNNALMTPEANNIGLQIIEKIDELGYKNITRYRGFDKGQARWKIGFHMTKESKHSLILTFKEYFEEENLLILSEDTLDEMSIFMDIDGKMGNKKGTHNHDDSVIAHALALRSLLEWRNNRVWLVRHPDREYNMEEDIY